MTKCYKCKYSYIVKSKKEWIKEFSDSLDFDSDYYPSEKEIFENALINFEDAVKNGELIPA